MCDTMVALGNSTENGEVLFAKNSDRQPDEPHIMVRVPAMRHDLGKEPNLQVTYIKIPQVQETYEAVLLKPSWIWGCEMGWNEFGLNIGNEAVFTKEKKGSPALIGMDMVRLALERCKAGEEALELMTELLEAYGQGGNCGYTEPFTYHNSFLIADRESAWVLETAGKYWAAKKVRDIYCISNCLSIENDFDRCHPETVRHAVEKGWCKGREDFSFARCYSDRLYTAFSQAENRRSSCNTALRNAKGRINTGLMKSILRSHHEELKGKVFRKKSLKSVCMHAGGLIGDQTTGSYIAEIREGLCTYWITGASAPCVAVFKPVWSTGEMPIFNEQETEKAVDYWMQRERLHRMMICGTLESVSYLKERDQLEQAINSAVRAMNPETADKEQLSNAMKRMFEIENEFVNNQIKKSWDHAARVRGGLYYRHYWKSRMRKANSNTKK